MRTKKPLTEGQKAALRFSATLAKVLHEVGFRGPCAAVMLWGRRTVRASSDWGQYLRRTWWERKVRP